MRAAILGGFALFLTAGAAFAIPPVQICDSTGNRCVTPNADGSIPTTSTAAGGGSVVTGTDASGTVTQANVFQTLQVANGVRKGCTVQNTSTTTEQVRIGATVFTLTPGQPISCASGLVVAGDAVAITSATAGAQFSAVFQ